MVCLASTSARKGEGRVGFGEVVGGAIDYCFGVCPIVRQQQVVVGEGGRRQGLEGVIKGGENVQILFATC